MWNLVVREKISTHRKNFILLENRIDARIDKIDARIDKVDARIDKLEVRIDKTMEIISEAIISMLNINETMINILARAKLILPEEQILLYKSYSTAHTNMFKISLKWLGVKPNPFTKEEANRLGEYVNMMFEGKKFSLPQATDFHEIVHKVEDEYWRALKAGEEVPSLGGGIGLLIAMSAFIFGGALAVEDEAKKTKGGDE